MTVTIAPPPSSTADVDSSHIADGTDDVPAAIRIEPRAGWRAIDLSELWRYRELVFFLTWRDVKVRYKQTVLGAAWAVIQPVMTMIVFTIFFGKLGGMDEQTKHAYPIFVYAALLPWQFFGSAVTQSGQSLITGANLLSKVYFPRLIMPIAAVGAALVDLLISFCVMALLMVYYQVPLTAHILLLPVLVVATIITTVGVGTLLSALTVAYRDFRYVVPFMVQLWMFASPVAYAFDVVPAKWRLLYALNPMAGVIAGYRACLLGEAIPWAPLSISCSVGATFLIVGALYFRKVERRFADIV